MKSPAIIRTKRPTAEEVARLLGVPNKEVKVVRALVAEWVNSPDTISRFGASLNGRKTSADRTKLKPAKRKAPENGHR
jgi:hypothetical protein